MRKILTVGLVASSLVLAQCSTTQVQNIETFLGQVQAYTAQVCKFVPTIDTIISIVNSGIGQIVGAVGTAICNSIPAPGTSAAARLPLVNSGPPAKAGNIGNVPIKGWRIP